MSRSSVKSLKKPFKSAVEPKPVNKPALKPFSVRFSDQERAYLERKAGRKPLGTYIRDELLGDFQTTRKKVQPTPTTDYELLGRIVGLLGKSELAANLCVLATAAESGALYVDEETKTEIFSARADIRDMRLLLLKGLGLKPEDR